MLESLKEKLQKANGEKENLEKDLKAKDEMIDEIKNLIQQVKNLLKMF